jgi:hypothetical protein
MSSCSASTSTVGAVEHSQNFILERQSSCHQQLNEYPVSSAQESTPLVVVVHDNNERESYNINSNNDQMNQSKQQQPRVDHDDLTNSTSYSSFAPSTTSSSSQCARAEGSCLPVLHNIRFQVVVWSVGAVDVAQSRVPVTFRVTLFWNEATNTSSTSSSPESCRYRKKSMQPQQHWQMRGRQIAVQQEMSLLDASSAQQQTVQVPPISILNVATFDTIGSPDITLLRPAAAAAAGEHVSRLWRWSCMYRATLIQDHWCVANFPHDEHDIVLKLAILAHRKPGDVWDRNVWKLDLATDNDSQRSTRVPHGLVVDQVSIPGFRYNKQRGLEFEFCTLDHGPTGMVNMSNEQVLKVKLAVMRDSSYYDRNIVPLMGLLNFVAISILVLDAQDFFERALLTMNIAFVEIGMRMTTDKHLPSVSYQIKMQKILNEYFICLLLLVLESNVVYEMHRAGFEKNVTNFVDWLAAVLVFSHNAWTLYGTYISLLLCSSLVVCVNMPALESCISHILYYYPYIILLLAQSQPTMLMPIDYENILVDLSLHDRLVVNSESRSSNNNNRSAVDFVLAYLVHVVALRSRTNCHFFPCLHCKEKKEEETSQDWQYSSNFLDLVSCPRTVCS